MVTGLRLNLISLILIISSISFWSCSSGKEYSNGIKSGKTNDITWVEFSDSTLKAYGDFKEDFAFHQLSKGKNIHSLFPQNLNIQDSSLFFKLPHAKGRIYRLIEEAMITDFPSRSIFFAGYKGEPELPTDIFFAQVIEQSADPEKYKGYGLVYSLPRTLGNISVPLEDLEKKMGFKIFKDFASIRTLSVFDSIVLKHEISSKNLLETFKELEQSIEVRTPFNTSPNYDRIPKESPIKQLANSIKYAADTVVNLMTRYKKEMVIRTGGSDEYGIPNGKDNQDFGYEYLMTETSSSRADTLVELITVFRDLLIKESLDLNPDLVAKFKSTFDISDRPDPYDDSKTISFGALISEHLPLASVTANLSLWQTYVRNAEADFIEILAKEIEK